MVLQNPVQDRTVGSSLGLLACPHSEHELCSCVAMGFKCPFRHVDSEKGKEPATPGVMDLWGEPKDPDICFLQCSWEQKSHWNFPKPLLTLWLPSPDIGAVHLLTAWLKDLDFFPPGLSTSQSIQSVMVPTPFALSPFTADPERPGSGPSLCGEAPQSPPLASHRHHTSAGPLLS